MSVEIDLNALEKRIPTEMLNSIKQDADHPLLWKVEKFKVYEDKLYTTVFMYIGAFLYIYKYSKITGNILENCVTIGDYYSLKEMMEGGE